MTCTTIYQQNITEATKVGGFKDITIQIHGLNVKTEIIVSTCRFMYLHVHDD